MLCQTAIYLDCLGSFFVYQLGSILRIRGTIISLELQLILQKASYECSSHGLIHSYLGLIRIAQHREQIQSLIYYLSHLLYNKRLKRLMRKTQLLKDSYSFQSSFVRLFFKIQSFFKQRFQTMKYRITLFSSSLIISSFLSSFSNPSVQLIHRMRYSSSRPCQPQLIK